MGIIEIKNVAKKYGDFIAVDGVTLNIQKGEIFGLLGPNGAGKSTTISMICGLLRATKGEISILGGSTKKEFDKNKRYLGLVPQNIAVYSNFTAKENVQLYGELYGLRGTELKKAVEQALEYTGLLDVKNKLAKEFSGGMQRRLNIACAIVHKPKIIIMDEPTVGIDPQSRNHILSTIKKLNNEGATVIYTSHYMEEVEAICTKIAIMDHGKVIVEGTKEELENMISDKKVLDITIGECNEECLKGIKNVKGVISYKYKDDILKVTTDKAINNLDKIISYITENKIQIRDIDYKEVNLETVFLTLTGRSLRD
ncbi:MAG: ABC transporter ATP-binding protein [Clostridium sp.]